jgi:hypothetical protein
MAERAIIRILGFLLPMKRVWLQSVLSVQGLMQLLMKPRNGAPWTLEDRLEIRQHLKMLGSLTPTIALFALPGGTLLLPLLAWFLDRRHNRERVKKP